MLLFLPIMLYHNSLHINQLCSKLLCSQINENMTAIVKYSALRAVKVNACSYEVKIQSHKRKSRCVLKV